MIRVTTAGARALVRSGAGPDYSIVGSRNNGDIVEVFERQAGWARIGTGQWITENLLTEDAEGTEDVITHPRRPRDPRWRMLVNFATNSVELLPQHRQWLRRTAASLARLGQHIWVRGLASRIDDVAVNQNLSERRAEAVQNFLVRECGVSAGQIGGFLASVGERWSPGSPTDNSGQWRAVEVIITNNVVEASTILVVPDLSSRFFVKFSGGGGGGQGIEVGFIRFMIRLPANRNRHDCWQEYLASAAGVGAGPIPFSSGDSLPPGRGWVEFRTTSPVYVTDFAGPVRLSQAGIQASSVGGSYLSLAISHATSTINVPTGRGFALGASSMLGRISATGSVRRDSNWELF